VPVGSGHNTGDIRFGTFHFLEHIVMNRSKAYPEYKQWSKKIGLVGGYTNAMTTRKSSTFIASVPSEHGNLIYGLFDTVFSPIFNEEDIIGERNIIKNERKGKERWFPGDDETGHYLWTEWFSEDPDYIYQRLGRDEDLDAMDASYLQFVHEKYYFNKNSFLMIGGIVDIEPILTLLENVKTNQNSPDLQERKISWKDKEYREASFNDLNRYIYRLGNITEKNFKKNLIGRFALILLTNAVQGPLYRWLRDEKKWVYGIGFEIESTYENNTWQLVIPLSHPDHVADVRSQLLGKIKEAFSDETLIASEKERFLGQQKFQFETVGQKMDFLLGWYRTHQIIVNETMLVEIIDSITSQDLLALLDDTFGEILTTSLKKEPNI